MRRLGAVLAACFVPFAALAQVPGPSVDLSRLLRAYPDFLDRIEGNDLVWKDGTRMPIDEGRTSADHEAFLAAADIKDMLADAYPVGVQAAPPARDHDPGRARSTRFFNKMYGDCTKNGVTANLVDVVWLPRKWGRTVRITGVNGVAETLARVSAELDALPATFDRFLLPPAGTYVCRPIAGTSRVSAHGHGIAFDIATTHSDYWLWAGGKRGAPAYRNRIPPEIVAIFEKHGFIWGGKWYHYDTMHFEYRPEVLPAQVRN